MTAPVFRRLWVLLYTPALVWSEMLHVLNPVTSCAEPSLLFGTDWLAKDGEYSWSNAIVGTLAPDMTQSLYLLTGLHWLASKSEVKPALGVAKCCTPTSQETVLRENQRELASPAK